MLALSSLASSRDSRPKQEILDDLLEQARQVRSGQDGAWGHIMSFHQARQHQENEALDHQQHQPGENAKEEVSSFLAELLFDGIYVQSLPEAILSEAIF